MFFDGPWQASDVLRKFNAFVRYSEGTAANGLAITALAYTNSWHSTDHIPVRAVSDGSLQRAEPAGVGAQRHAARADEVGRTGNRLPSGGAEPREDLQIPQMHEDRDEVSALKALLAFEPSDTTNGVIAGSIRQTRPSTVRKNSRKRNWRS